jgi:hypothetical protein
LFFSPYLSAAHETEGTQDSELATELTCDAILRGHNGTDGWIQVRTLSGREGFANVQGKHSMKKPSELTQANRIQEAVVAAIRSGIPREDVFEALRDAVREADATKLADTSPSIDASNPRPGS